MNRSANFHDTEIIYEVQGQGQVLVLIHGFAEDYHIWDAPMAVLSRAFKVIAPDLPGSGRSPFNSRYTTIDDFADAIRAILDQESIGTCSLVGHSMGGYIGLAFAEKYPDRLDAIGLFHSTAYADTEEKKKIREKSIGFIEKHGSPAFIEQSLPGLFSDEFSKLQPEKLNHIVNQYANFNPASLIAYYRAMISRPDRTWLLKSIHVPVLLVLGERDKAVPFNDGLKQSYLPEICYLHIFRKVAHMGMIEHPAESAGLLNRFLRDIYPS